MAEGLLKHITQGAYDVASAGTMPSVIRPEAIEVCVSEIGIDISTYKSKSALEFSKKEIDFVLDGCNNAHENCP